MDLWSIVFLVFGIIGALCLIGMSVKLIEQYEVAVVLRLGKFRKLGQPGFLLLIPFVDSILERVDTRVQTDHILVDSVLTKDTVPVKIDAIMFWQVTDSRKAALEVTDYADNIGVAAETALRHVAGTVELDELLSNRDTVDEHIQNAIAAKATAWGLQVNSIEIKDVSIPDSLQNAMSQQAQAQREAGARSLLAQSEVTIAQRFVDAAKVYAENPIALQLRSMNLSYEAIKTGQTNTILLPVSGLDGLSAVTGLIKAT